MNKLNRISVDIFSFASYVWIVSDTLKLLDHLVPGGVSVPHDTSQDLFHCGWVGNSKFWARNSNWIRWGLGLPEVEVIEIVILLAL